MPTERTKCVIYIRVSTKEQAEEGFSLDAQLSLLRAYAADRGMEVVGEFVDMESAKRAGRRQFGQMLRFIPVNGVGAIVVEKTDRIYRNEHDAVAISDLDIQLHLVKENSVISRSSRSHEKFVHRIKVAVAANYVDNLSEETKKGMAEKARQGIWPSCAPIGYRNVSIGVKRTIEPDPGVAEQIRSLFETYATGDYSMKHAGAIAGSLGLRTKTGRRVHTSTIHLILQNPLYVGLVRWNGETYPGIHEPLVDMATFEAVQEVLAGRQVLCARTTKPEFAYRGLFRCGRCGCSMSPELKKGKYIYYSCSGFKGCPRIAVTEASITEQVATVLEGLRVKPFVIDLLRRALRESFSELKEDQDRRMATLRSERGRVTAQLEQLYIDKISGEVPQSVYPTLKAQWEEKLVLIDEQLAATERASRATWDDNVAMLELLSNSADRFRKASAEHRREMFKSLVSNSQITDGTVEIELRPEFNLILEANLQLVETAPPARVLENWLPAKDSNLD